MTTPLSLLKSISQLSDLAKVHFTFTNLSNMRYPLFFYVAFVLGIHTHSGARTQPYFLSCGCLCLTFVLCNNCKSVYDVINLKPDSFVMMLVLYRAFIGPYLIVAGFLDYKSVEINCARILSEMSEANRKIVERNLLIIFVYLFSIGLPDIYFRSSLSTDRLEWMLVFLTGLMSRSICIVTVLKFNLQCEALQMSYRQLQDDITHTYSRLAVFTMSRLRARHLEICEFEKVVNGVFGLRLFVFILMLQLGVLETTHILVDTIVLEKYSLVTVVRVYTLLDFFVMVLVLSSFTRSTSVKVSFCLYIFIKVSYTHNYY